MLLVQTFIFVNNFYIFLMVIFLLGLVGLIFNFRNLVLFFIAIELLLLVINLSFIITSILLNDFFGLGFAILILTVAAAEAAIGLALLVLFYRVRSNILVSNRFYLRG